MQLTDALRERDRERDADRLHAALQNPHRRDAEEPLDHRHECQLGRMRVKNEITEEQYQAGVKWRGVYASWLHSIQSPEELSDDDCEFALKSYERGRNILEGVGKRVFHAVNAIVVFEEPEELGDQKFTSCAARIGLSELALKF